MLRQALKTKSLDELQSPLAYSEATEVYRGLERTLSKETRRKSNFSMRNVLLLYLERYNHIFSSCFRFKALDKLCFMRPPTSFFHLHYLFSFGVGWTFSVLMTAIYATAESSLSDPVSIIIWSLVCSVIETGISFLAIFLMYRFYIKEIKEVFRQEKAVKDPSSKEFTERELLPKSVRRQMEYQ